MYVETSLLRIKTITTRTRKIYNSDGVPWWSHEVRVDDGSGNVYILTCHGTDGDEITFIDESEAKNERV